MLGGDLGESDTDSQRVGRLGSSHLWANQREDAWPDLRVATLRIQLKAGFWLPQDLNEMEQALV